MRHTRCGNPFCPACNAETRDADADAPAVEECPTDDGGRLLDVDDTGDAYALADAIADELDLDDPEGWA